jgi:hypothetical protein
MRRPRALLAATVPLALVGWLGLACQSTPTDTGGSTCPIPSGTFTERFTVEYDAACPPLPDQTLTLDGTTSFTATPSGAEADAGDAGDGITQCMTDVDSTTCTFSSNCTTTVDGGTTQVVFTAITFDGDVGAGRVTIEPNTCSTTSCSYAIAITKS